MYEKFSPAKLLITIVAKHYAELALEVIKKAGATGGTRAAGRGLATYLPSGGLDTADAHEDLIFSVIPFEADNVFQAVLKAAIDDPEDLSGMALLIDVPGALLNRYDEAEPSSNILDQGRSKSMKPGSTLITSIINHGEADDIMAVARKAGARGGTIINGRGTGTEEDVKFFGVSLVPEKEMLLIVADNAHTQNILKAISSLPIFNEPGSGIIFSVSVDQFAVLGNNTLD